MSINNVVLGILSERPSHGYELVKQIEARVGAAEIARPTVYAALHALERDGLAEALEPASAGDGRRPSLRCYRATPLGVERFEQWMQDAIPVPVARDALRLKFVVAHARHMPRLLELASGEERRCRACLDAARRHERSAPGPDDERHSWPDRAWAAASAIEASYWESRLAWLASLHRLFAGATPRQA